MRPDMTPLKTVARGSSKETMDREPGALSARKTTLRLDNSQGRIMNRVFSTVWNAPLGQLVVASELARGQKKGARGTSRGRRALKGVAVAGTASAAWDLQVDGSLGFTVPDNAVVDFVAGDNIVITPDGNGNSVIVATADSPQFGTIKINDGGKITGVTDGDLSASSDEVVTGGQLYKTNQDVLQNAGDISANSSQINVNTGDISDHDDLINTN